MYKYIASIKFVLKCFLGYDTETSGNKNKYRPVRKHQMLHLEASLQAIK